MVEAFLVAAKQETYYDKVGSMRGSTQNMVTPAADLASARISIAPLRVGQLARDLQANQLDSQRSHRHMFLQSASLPRAHVAGSASSNPHSKPGEPSATALVEGCSRGSWCTPRATDLSPTLPQLLPMSFPGVASSARARPGEDRPLVTE